MLKILKWVYRLGRRRAYDDMTTRLGMLLDELPRTREGQRIRQPILEAIDDLRGDVEKVDV